MLQHSPRSTRFAHVSTALNLRTFARFELLDFFTIWFLDVLQMCWCCDKFVVVRTMFDANVSEIHEIILRNCILLISKLRSICERRSEILTNKVRGTIKWFSRISRFWGTAGSPIQNSRAREHFASPSGTSCEESCTAMRNSQLETGFDRGCGCD